MAMELKLSQWPSQDERGGGAGPAGARGDDGAAHLPGRDFPQVNTVIKWFMNDIETLITTSLKCSV